MTEDDDDRKPLIEEVEVKAEEVDDEDAEKHSNPSSDEEEEEEVEEVEVEKPEVCYCLNLLVKRITLRFFQESDVKGGGEGARKRKVRKE